MGVGLCGEWESPGHNFLPSFPALIFRLSSQWWLSNTIHFGTPRGRALHMLMPGSHPHRFCLSILRGSLGHWGT